MTSFKALLIDESGFIISAELVLVATVLVLGMLVGMSQVQNAIVSELNDVAHAVGAANQSYYYTGFHARKWFGFTKSRTFGSAFYDLADACDAWGCNIACDGAYAEGANWGGACGGSCGGYGASYSSGCAPVETSSCGTVGGSCSPACGTGGGLVAP